MNRGVILFLVAGLSVGKLMAAPPAPTAVLLEGNVLCIRAGNLTDSFSDKLRSLQPTNQIVGTVLDLRFADGDEQTVDAAVKLFISKKTPLAMLVNSETRGAAADLATRLRAANAGILIGSANLPGKISTDILVTVSPEEERKFLADPFASAVTNGLAASDMTNNLSAYVDHMSEAELVRMRIKDGEDEGDAPLTPRAAPVQPVIRDPALARAVDLIEALAILKPAHG